MYKNVKMDVKIEPDLFRYIGQDVEDEVKTAYINGLLKKCEDYGMPAYRELI